MVSTWCSNYTASYHHISKYFLQERMRDVENVTNSNCEMFLKHSIFCSCIFLLYIAAVYCCCILQLYIAAVYYKQIYCIVCELA